MQRNNLIKTMTLSALFSTALIACSRDKENDTNSPACHIEKSESLAIPASIDLPDNLPGGNTRIATFYAAGVQKYKAQPKAGSNPVTFEWIFEAPRADLF
jgi:hypothetical protein